MRLQRRFEACFGEDDRLGAAHRVGDEAPGMQPVERIPIESLPGARLVMQSMQEQSENGLVDAIEIRLVVEFGDLRIVAPPEGDHRSIGHPTLRLRHGFPGTRAEWT